MTNTATDRMKTALMEWLGSCPEFREWKQKDTSRTLWPDDGLVSGSADALEDFKFPGKKADEYAVVHRFIGLLSTVESLKQCEYYFRRYPFHNLPVSQSDHLTNICEMYFGRIYEFKERLKKYFKALKNAAPRSSIEAGKFIKAYKKTFSYEFKTRNPVIHDWRFNDVEIDRIYLRTILVREMSSENKVSESVQKYAKSSLDEDYRKVAGFWVQQVRTSSKEMDRLTEIIAEDALENCPFLSVFVKEK